MVMGITANMGLAELFGRGKILILEDRVRQLEKDNEYLEEDKKFLEAKVKRLAEENQGLRNQRGPETGKITRLGRDFGTVNYYFEKGNTDGAVKLLRSLFGDSEIIGNTALIYLDNNNMGTLVPSGAVQSDYLSVKEAWVYKRMADEASAEELRRVHSMLQAEGSATERPNSADAQRAKEFLRIRRVLGPSLHEFYQAIESRGPTPASETLKEELMLEQLRASAYLSTRDYGIDRERIARTMHGIKMLEVARIAGAGISSEEKAILQRMFSQLDTRADIHMRDGTGFNYNIEFTAADEFLSPEFLSSTPNREEVRKKVRQAMHAYDFEKIPDRLTFPQDEFWHSQLAVPKLSAATARLAHEFYFSELRRHGADVSEYWKFNNLAGFYRNTRFFGHYTGEAERFPDPEGAERMHHASAAGRCLENLRNEGTHSYQAIEAAAKLVRSMVDSGSRPQAIIYPADNA